MRREESLVKGELFSMNLFADDDYNAFTTYAPRCQFGLGGWRGHCSL